MGRITDGVGWNMYEKNGNNGGLPQRAGATVWINGVAEINWPADKAGDLLPGKNWGNGG